MATRQAKIKRTAPANIKTHAEDPILTLAEAGRMIGKGGEYVKRWCDRGAIPYLRLPSGVYAVRQSTMYKHMAMWDESPDHQDSTK